MASRVGQYLLFETLGEGAFGKVKLGVHEETGEQVAVKIMDKSDIRAQEMTMNVRREIAIMKALKHKNIVNLRQVLTSSSKLYIVMDLVTGGELFTKILNEGKLEENVARSYFQQLVDGIEYCHRRGVCHRDLKPENLLIDETTGELKITDFGLSAMKGASTTEELLHTQCGSPNYCAPEIIARHRQGYNGAKVDAWSCGIILFALLAGFLPFYDENTKVLYRMIQRDDVKFPRKFPPEAKDLVLKLLHKEPERRYTLQEVKRHPWFSVGYSGESSTSSNSSPPSSSQGRSRRRRGHNRTRSTDTGPRSRTGSDAVPPAPATPPAPQAAPPLPTPPVVPQQAPAPPPVPVAPAPPPVRTSIPPPPPPPTRASAPPVVPQVVPPAALPVVPPSRASAPPAAPAVRMSPPSATPPSRGNVPIPPPPPPRVNPPSVPVAPPAPPVPPPVYLKPAVPVPPPVPQPPKIPKAVVAEAAVHHPPPVPPPSHSVASPPQITHSSPPPIVPPPKTMKPPITASPLRRSAPNPSVPSPTRQTREYTKTVDVGDQRDPGPGDTMPADARNESLPEVEKDVIFPNSVAFPAPSSSPVTSTSEVNTVSSGSIPVAPPKPEVLQYSAPKPSSETVRPESLPNAALLPLNAIYSREEDLTRVEKLTYSAQPAGRSDTSWQRRSSPEPSTTLDSKITDAKPAEGGQTAPAVLPSSVRMSFVEQRRAMYDKLAGGKPINPVPLTDSSRGTTAAEWESDFSAPKSTPLPKKENASIPRKTSVPNAGSVQRRFDDPAVATHGQRPISNGQADVAIPTPEPKVSVTPAVIPVVPPPVGPVAPHTEVFRSQNSAEFVDQTSNGIHNDADTREDRKKRTRAALARYRRIFRLGNNIGITGSPSFNSNQGKLATVDEGKPENSPSRAEFFARAKAVTGAWGVILTQELEEESDSEDDERQVTDEELAAFGKLLDFWDNRRASATMSQKDEVVLDDEHSTPLTEQDITSIQSLLHKLEPKREDDVEEVAQPASMELYGNGQDQSEEIQQLLERDFSNPSVDSIGNQPGSPRPRSVSNMEQSTKSGLRMSASVDILSARLQQGQATGAPPPPPPPPPPPVPPTGAGPRVIGAPPPPNRSGGVFPAPTQYAPQPPADTLATPPRLTVTQSTLRDPFRPKLPPSYPSGQFPGPAGLNDSFPTVSTTARIEANQLARGGAKIPQSISMDDRLHAMANRKSSNEKKPPSPMERKPSSSRDLGRDDTTHSEGSVVGGRTSISKNPHIRTPSRDDTATRGMFAFSMFSRKKSGAASSFDANLPLDKCLVEVGRILQGLGCSVMMKRGESKMKCEAPVKNSEKMLVSVTCTHSGGKTKVMFKKGRKDRSRVDAKEFYEFFQTVYNRFLQKIESESKS